MKHSFSAQSYLIPAHEVRHETVVINSRFIATLAPVFSVEEAKAFISRVRSEFADASHNVPAYLVGFGSSVVAHCNDDGEPSGTAGRPALAVLQGSGLGDVAVVVTRYFGGTKLGTGGLVRAYSDAVRQVVALAPRARKVPVHIVMVGLPYNLFEQTRLLVEAHEGQLLDQDFAAEITLTVRFPTIRLNSFQAALSELTNGTRQAILIETGEVLMPLSDPDK
jgi:uncharacterized YigZ family protein